MNRVPGPTRHEQAVRVAGAMAELSVRDLILRRNGACTGLLTRQTDLPAVLDAMPAGSRLECASIGVVIELGSEGLVWGVVAGGKREAFAAALGCES